MDTSISCPQATVPATPYNARGRAMRLGFCPVCGKERRATGPGVQITIPEHAPQKQEA